MSNLVYQCALNFTLNNYQCARILFVPDNFPPVAATPDGMNKPDDPNGRFTYYIPAGYTGGGNVVITKQGCKPINHRLQNAQGINIPIPASGAIEILGETLNPSRPPVPSRETVLGMNTSFMGGMLIDSPEYGKMPWWDSALSWCGQATRNLVYQGKKDNTANLPSGPETHCILEVPNGKPLYDEPDQFYNPSRFPALDWTNGLTSLNEQFNLLLEEIIDNGFIAHIAMDEIFEQSIQIIPLVAQRLKDLGLTKYCVVMPGYDAVFYGWTPEQIMQWGALARSINPDIYLCLEFNPGHIPLGEGGGDYYPGGRMKDFDMILAEVNWPPDPTIWAIFGRCLTDYKQQPDQTSDFPPMPFYLVDSERGPRFFNGFESDWPFYWVRVDPNDPVAVQVARVELQTIRNYFISCGSHYNG